MCGIVGYTGPRNAARVLIEGLKQLEYRGYDSFGLATLGNGIEWYKRAGRIGEAEKDAAGIGGKTGIGHTRWATHGIPDDCNAHPHLDCTGRIAVVHNGIIENYTELRRSLKARGHILRSETDTEVIAHLIEEHSGSNLLDAVRDTLPELTGSYAILAIRSGEEGIVAARKNSPLVIGVADGEYLAASDSTPLIDYTSRVIYLEDGDLAHLSASGVRIFHEGAEVVRPVERLGWSPEEARRGGFPHFMLKEIYEQPGAFSDTVRTVCDLPEILLGCRGLTVVACGSSYHAGLIFKYIAEEACQIPVRVDLASEYKYFMAPTRDPVIGITQSGETADTNAALQSAKVHNIPTLAITNVLGSSVTRIADETVYMRAGPEMSVAATKSFIAELAVLIRLASLLSDRSLDITLDQGHRAIEEALLTDMGEAVQMCSSASHIFYVGRGPFYPVALEGALKMKEISYIHAEGYAAGEIKHGPFALLSRETPVIAVCTPGSTHDVMIANIKEMEARSTPVIALGSGADRELDAIADILIPLPDAAPVLQPVAATVILQLLAYRTADALGRDIDKPRNLAKSVTVE
ncbi:MAG: glutamine--fructose-6-phosphate transaminase (isomerizing) [Methanoregulaceae archaeon]|nr:glutamine--fructose-6-phosphate transaminase (isomerizing) [Methanoregulaceae archaeon]